MRAFVHFAHFAEPLRHKMLRASLLRSENKESTPRHIKRGDIADFIINLYISLLPRAADIRSR